MAAARQWAGQRSATAWMWLAALATTLIVGSYAASAHAVSAPPAPAPEASWVANGQVWDVAASGHTLYIGGMFNRIGPPTGPFAVVNATTGARQTSWPLVAGGDAQVETIVSDGSGGWYLGGNFTSVGGTAIRNLAHITAGGTLDTAFEPDPDGTVRSIVLAPDGKTLYATGNFTQIGGEERSELAAVSTSEGMTLHALAPGFGGFEFIPNRHGTALALAPSTNTLYACAEGIEGGLMAFNLSTGRPNSTFAPQITGCRELVASPDGQTLYISGVYNIDGQSRSGLGAVNATTGAVTSFNPPEGSGPLALTSDGATLYIGHLGSLQKITTATGAVDSSFKAPTDEVMGLALSPDQSKLYVSGAFPQPAVTELNATTGSVESSFSAKPNGAPGVVAVAGSGVALGGDNRVADESAPFNSLGGVECEGFAAIDETTGEPTSLKLSGSTRFALSPDGSTLYAIAPLSYPKRTKLIRVDTATGAISSSFSAQTPGSITALAVSPDGSTLYVGGIFTEIGGHAATNLAALNTSDGSFKSSFAASVTGNTSNVGVGHMESATINSLTVSPDGSKLFIGGNFNEINGHAMAHLGAVNTSDGSLESSFAPSLPSNQISGQTIMATAINATGSLLYAGGPSFELRAYETATGKPSTTFNPSLALEGELYGLTLSPDGSTLYVAGLGIQAVNATTGATIEAFNPSVPSAGLLQALTFMPDGALAAGGMITSIDQTPVGGFAMFSPSGGAPVNAAPPNMGQGDLERDFLATTAGVWSGAQPISVHYQWLRDGAAIPGANSPTYYFKGEDLGHHFNVEVTATNGSGQASATSFPYWDVGFPSAPINSEPPQISGTPTVSSTLTAAPGKWFGSEPITYSYQWLQNGVAIPGATASTYVIASADGGHELTVKVTASNYIGEASATSESVQIPIPTSNTGGSDNKETSGGGTTSGSGNTTAASGSTTTSNSGSQGRRTAPTATAAQKLAKALKACKKMKSKGKRKKCEAQAKKRYEPKPKPHHRHQTKS